MGLNGIYWDSVIFKWNFIVFNGISEGFALDLMGFNGMSEGFHS